MLLVKPGLNALAMVGAAVTVSVATLLGAPAVGVCVVVTPEVRLLWTPGVLLVTHDVDEAILLADRVVMMTNGPHAKIGKIETIDLPRPRTRKALLAHPDYYKYRESLLTFLTECDHTY